MSRKPAEPAEQIAQLETWVEENPRPYRMRALLYALFAHAYFALFPVLIVAAMIGTGIGAFVMRNRLPKGTLIGGTAGITAVLVILLVMVLRVLFVKVAKPPGVPLRRSDVGRLFGQSDEARKRTDVARIDYIHLTGEFAIRVVQVPRGLFGRRELYLLLGLPLLHALSHDEIRSRICRELFHFGRGSSFSSHIYRQRRLWLQRMEALRRSRRWGTFLYRRFTGWFAPRFNTYTFLIARANEFEADRAAARLFGARIAGVSHSVAAVRKLYLEESFWPAYLRRADTEPNPTAMPHTLLRKAMETDISQHEACAWLDRAMHTASGYHDTQLALADRLAAIGQEPELPRPLVQTAAENYSGRALPAITAQIDQLWWTGASGDWRRRHERAKQERNELAALEAKAPQNPLSPDEAVRFAVLTERFRGADAALPLYEQLEKRLPGNPLVAEGCGRLLLQRGDGRGVALLERAMAAKPEYVASACHRIAVWLISQGRAAESASYRDRIINLSGSVRTPPPERARSAGDEVFLPHDFDDDTVHRIALELEADKRIKSAWLVRKDGGEAGEHHLYVLGLRLKFGSRSSRKSTAVIESLSERIAFAGDILPVAVSRATALEMHEVPGAAIFER